MKQSGKAEAGTTDASSVSRPSSGGALYASVLSAVGFEHRGWPRLRSQPVPRTRRRSSKRWRRPTAQPAIPSQYRPEEIVGRWGYGAYHKDEDLARTAAAARNQCGQPVEITRGPNGGVMMYLADSAQLQELQLKGSQSGKNYIGPPGDAGGPQDREIVSFDGRTMVLKWMDPEVAGRYGTGVYVRCAPEGTARAAGRPPMKPPGQ